MIGRLGYLFLELMLLVVQVSAYISNSYGGYLFTTPDNTDANRRTKVDAVTWCKNNGTKLLEIPSNTVQTAVVQYAKDLFSAGNFNGWSTIVNAKRYGQNWDWVNGQGISSLNVEQQSPDLTKSFGFLQATASRILVAAGVATDQKPYICEGSSYCSTGVKFNQRCYKGFSDTPLSWFYARNKCLDGGGDLASFDFVSTSPGLSILNGTWLNPSLSYWIGIRRALWKWEDSNAEVKYTQWVDGQPDFSFDFECICLYYVNWMWMMCDCASRYQFLCLTAVITSPTTTTSTSTTTTRTTTTTFATTTTLANMITKPDATTVKSLITVNYLSSTSLTSSYVGLVGGSESIPVESVKSSSLSYNAGLGIGLGIGIGGGVIISAIIVAIYILARRRGWPGTFPVLKQSEPSDPNHQQMGTSYARIPTSMQHQPSVTNTNSNEGSSKIVYSDLEHLSSSTTPADTSFMENFSSTSTNATPGESSNGEIMNGHVSPFTVI